jgi:hypothetical protein
VVGGDPIVQMTPPGELPSLDHPSLVPIERHSDPPPSSQPLVGMRVGEEERGYPLGLLERYEVVNDRAADLDYVVARCALTDITAVYDRRVGDRLLTFINSGALWRDTLVLQDRETGTLWTAATGTGLVRSRSRGSVCGRSRPSTRRLARSGRRTPRRPYLDTRESTRPPVSLSLYAASPWQGISGVKTNDRRYDPKEKLFFVAEGSEALAFRAEDLKRLGRVEDTLAGRPILLEWDAAVDAPAACRPGESGGEEAVAVVPATGSRSTATSGSCGRFRVRGPAPVTTSSTTAAR